MASTSHGQAHRWKHSPGLAPRASTEVAKVPAKTVLSPSSKQGTQGWILVPAVLRRYTQGIFKKGKSSATNYLLAAGKSFQR